jgi:hypothetical protein
MIDSKKVAISAVGSQYCGNGSALPSPLRGGERAAFAALLSGVEKSFESTNQNIV